MADELVFHQDDWGMPSASDERLPPFGEPFAHIHFDGDSLEFVFGGVFDDVCCEGAFSARDFDLEWSPRACPFKDGDLHGFWGLFGGHGFDHALKDIFRQVETASYRGNVRFCDVMPPAIRGLSLLF